jgi:hypothetical protein
MTVETNSPTDQGAMETPALFANRVQAMACGSIIRLAFAEAFAGERFFYRTAVSMTVSDARDLANAIYTTLDLSEGHIRPQTQ